MIASVPAIGSSIWAHVVQAGMIIRTPDGTRVAVHEVNPGYSTWTFSDGIRSFTVEYADRVEVLGYFNP